MPKTLRDSELFEIIENASDEIDDRSQYISFLKAIGKVITDHFGGDVIEIDDDPTYQVKIEINESVPCDGGVFRKYDIHTNWKNGIETHI